MGQLAFRRKMKTVKPITEGSLRIVNIRDDLKPVEKQDRYSTPERVKEALERIRKPERLIPDQTTDWRSRKRYAAKVLAHYENVEINHLSHDGSLFGAFIQAYNNHEDITLVPDDIWITILFQFSKYINNNAEKMRSMFVSHEGKKQLTVTTSNQLEESQWEEFFELMIIEIKKNTKDGIVDIMQPNFSTTGLVEQMVSVATVMDSFKKYFDFGRMIPCCGIKNVRFAGTLEDWQSVLSRLQSLAKYDVNGKWKKYVDGLVPVISQFIETYNGNVDTVFWDKVMNLRHGSLGSGGTTYVTGWILAFYGQTGEVDIGDIDNDFTIDVPVKIDNKLTGVVKMVRLRATFAGLNKTDGSYRPQMSMIVCELESDNEVKEAAKDVKLSPKEGQNDDESDDESDNESE
jgi:hypothetical protein